MSVESPFSRALDVFTTFGLVDFAIRLRAKMIRERVEKEVPGR
jgi:hypothetical protein